MATLVFSSTEDSQVEAKLLVEALTLWLAEQPVQPLQGAGKAVFAYRADGTLDSITTMPVSD